MSLTARKLLLAVSATSVVAGGLFISSAPAFSADNVPGVADVMKNDGSVDRYRLLPVHFEPEHAAVVEARLAHVTRDSSLPTSYQIDQSLLPPVRDQGQRGTCAYFATVGTIEAHYIRKNPAIQSTLKVSEECLVDVRNWEFDQGDTFHGVDKPAQRPDPNGDLPNSIILTVNAHGVPEAKEYANGVSCVYDGSNTKGNDVSMDLYSETIKQSAAYGKGLNFTVSTAPTIDMIRGLIAQNVPVEIGLVVYNEYEFEKHWSYNAIIDQSFNVAGGHAVILTGYTTDANGKTTFTFKNSWGTAWGNAGYGLMDESVLTHSWSYEADFDFIAALK